MATTFLTPANTYDVKAIMVSAWANARAAVKKNAGNRSFCRFSKVAIDIAPLTVREAFRDALAQAWSLAKAQRAYALFCAEREAEAARLALAPVRERALAELAKARVEALHIDSTVEMISIVDTIDAEIASLRSAA